jgi:hypothetical protein
MNGRYHAITDNHHFASMSSASIKAWLREIPDNRHQYTHLRRPRKRQRRQHPVTPDLSKDCAFAMPPRCGSPSKRQTLATNKEQPEDKRMPRLKRVRSRRSESEHISSLYLSYYLS